MKRLNLTMLVWMCCWAMAWSQPVNYAKMVNPFIGTGGHGHTYPGASMPFGMMQLSPDTRLEGWDGCGGYHYSDSLMYGFSHTHLSGTGVPDYCDLLLMPFTGAVQWKNKDYASPFRHATEKANAGYYEVQLDKHNIHAAVTTSVRSGMHQYRFPAGTATGKVLIDLQHRDEVLESSLEIVNAYELRGMRRSKSWAADQHVYFYIRFEKPIASYGIANDDVEQAGKKTMTGKNVKAWLSFALNGAETLRLKVGISGVSMANAKLNLDTEIKDWNFNALRAKAEAAWNKELGKIAVKGGTKDQQTIFYTALYHTMLAPNVYTDVNGDYRGTDLKVHKAKNFTNYSVFSLWDTHRALHPLLSIIDRKRTLDFVQTFLKQHQHGGMLPVWELSGNETFCMIGYHSVPVIVDAYNKGIKGFDTQLALQAMTAYAGSNRFGLDAYRKHGFIGNEKDHESASKTVEYAYDDWCIAEFAKSIGNKEVYNEYYQRAHYYRNLFDPTSKHIRGKMQGLWYNPFKPGEVNNFFTEGNSWHYSFSAQQDISGLINLHGGDAAFLKQLNLMFTTSEPMSGRDQADVTGLIGQYAHGNEPSHHIAYLFNYAGQAWRTQELIHRICTEFYTNQPDGLIGNEDCGQMSAWFVMSAMGFYQVTPGSNQYALGTPLFDEVKVSLENGKQLVIKASGRTANNFYVQSAKLNGKPYSPTFIRHRDIANGAVLDMQMSNQPNLQRGVAVQDRPATQLNDDAFVTVPSLANNSNKFAGSTQVEFQAVADGVGIYYRIRKAGEQGGNYQLYKAPFTLTETVDVDFYAQKGQVKSREVSQQFYRIPADKDITVLSKVNTMYSGGGNGMLIDGILGTEHWRGGEWQSYFDSNFEAVVDLRQSKNVSFVGVHVLQDVSPWIVYPKEVQFAYSNDGQNWQTLTTIANKIDATVKGPEVQTLGANVTANARYVKVTVVNGGLLPAWHESAGKPSHLFIDEVIVK